MRIPSSHRRQLARLLDVASNLIAHSPSDVAARYQAWASQVGHEPSPHSLLHAIAVTLPSIQAWQRRQLPHLAQWLRATAPDGVAAVLDVADDRAFWDGDDFTDCCHLHLYEELLAVDQRGTRKQRGVYYTPAEIAAYIVREVNQSLVDDFALSLGLTDATLDGAGRFQVRILDPAAGSGVFLAEVVRTIHRQFLLRQQQLGRSVEELAHLWNDYVPRQLLPRLAGWEILPPAVVAAHLALVDVFHRTGYRFEFCTPLQVELRDALAPPQNEPPFSVVLGNPPYASLSTAKHGWIESLIQSPQQGYSQVGGQPLGEKKHWLHDDYVKFLRLAQWHVEQSGQGIVGLVTNHGYLHNTSFRGLRDSLLKTFTRINLVDLHGNAKLQERSPDGSRDENVFGIASGVAIGIFAKSSELSSYTVRHSELWGSREAKLLRLTQGDLPITRLTPALPQRSFAPQIAVVPASHERAWLLSEAMPVNTTAPVTARDGFVVAFTREELVERLEAFVDLTISDDVLRQRYFGNTRSSRYLPGDSRGWKLVEARRVLADDLSWRDRIALCQYRPFDYRYVLWHPAMIDWPRPELTRHLLAGPNLALIARRQSPPSQPAHYFWATRRLALDGIIRSDNRGSESLFPVWIYDDNQPRANFSPAFIQALEQSTGLFFVDCLEELFSISVGGASEPRHRLTPLAVASYIYGLFWTSEYRTRYQSALAREFARVPLPENVEQFGRVSQQGQQLLKLHTEELSSDDELTPVGSLAAGHPLWRDGQAWLNATTPVCPVREQVWNLQIGTHQVARKWLKDRRGRLLTLQDFERYGEIIARLEQTVRLVDAIYFTA